MSPEREKVRILVPLDGSPLSETVLPALMPLISTREVELTLLRVISRVDELETERAYLARLEKTLGQGGVKATPRVEFGRPSEEIIHLAKPGAFHLVAMTTHGHTAFLRVVMGSVAAHVLRHIEIPLLLHTPHARIQDWKRFVVALDGTRAAESILEDVVPLAKILGSTVHLVRVTLPLLPQGDPYFDPIPVDREVPRRYLEEICDRLAAEGILTMPLLREGFPAQELIRTAADLGAGLIAMSTAGRGGRARAFDRSIAGEVLPKAPCPVLLRRASPAVSGAKRAVKQESAIRVLPGIP